MESRNLKQRGRQGHGEPEMLVVVSDEYGDKHKTNGAAGNFSAYPMAHGSGTGTGTGAGNGSKMYGAYPALAVDAREATGSDLTDFSAASLDSGLEGVLRSRDLVFTVVLTLLSAFSRLYRIGRANGPKWDEAHFGKFGAYYINGTFYHDVHPPLAKMLVALAEAVAGHNGTFDFKSGTKFPEYVNYTLMRIQVSMYGVALVPLAYLTCLQLNMSRSMATLAACFVLFDNALCVMSRFILLDEPLLFFTALTLWSAVSFQRVNKYGRQYSRKWWTWLLMTGFSLGCVMSSKWVGLFSVIMVGIATIDDLFRKYCDRMPWDDLAQHWNARVVALIFIPLIVYTASFWVHFRLLYRSGTGDYKMSSNFQAKLIGSRLNAQPYDVSYGAVTEIRSMFDGPGLLHSHVHRYPEGSKLQQVTCFPHRDVNNQWMLRHGGDKGMATNYTTAPIEFIVDGDTLQLVHNATGTMLQANTRFLAPLSKNHFEVTAANETDWDKGSRDWRVEVVKQKHRRRGDQRVHAMTTVFRLRHVETGCLMRVGSRRLPTWGWNQAEVTCLPDKSGKKNVKSSDVLWYVEHNINKRVPKDDLSRYVSSNFFVDMIQLNIEMGKTNNALSPDVNKYSVLESRPASWPFLIYPMRMVGWSDSNIKYYEIGNPILWWASAVVCIFYPFRLLFWALQMQRRCSRWRSLREFLDFWDNSKFLWGGWALHYIPFFFMGRVTYIHHHLPALYFGFLLLAFELDTFFKTWRRGRYLTVVAIGCGIVSGVVFLYFAPFTYGWDRPAVELAGRQWLSTWNIYTDKYAIDLYDILDPWGPPSSSSNSAANAPAPASTGGILGVPSLEESSRRCLDNVALPAVYAVAFSAAQKVGGGQVTRDALLETLEFSGLPRHITGQIVLTADTGADSLTQRDFNLALAMAALAQKNMSPTLESVMFHKEDLPLLNLDGVETLVSSSNGNSSMPPPPRAGLEAPDDPWSSAPAGADAVASSTAALGSVSLAAGGAETASAPANTGTAKKEQSRAAGRDSSASQTYVPAINMDELQWQLDKEDVSIKEAAEKGGIVFKHTNYEVSTRSFSSMVVRRYKDFDWISNYLVTRYPYRMHANIPPKGFPGKHVHLRVLERGRGMHAT
ncbi:Protein O-mannosyltransferase 2 [Coemansia erecta]|nr:Protein O-mannosyltransferase 2 [Coemansia erecta]